MADETVKELVLKKASASQIKNAAMKNNMSTLRQEGWKKAIIGVTTPEEVLNVTQADEITIGLKESAIVSEGTPKEVKTEERSFFSVPENPFQDIPAAKSGGVSAFPDNQRVFKRVHSKVNITYKITDSAVAERLGDQQLEHFAVTKDLSAGGLLFISDKSVPKGTILELTIRLPDGGAPLRCLSKIVRVAYRDMDGAYDIAVCFLDLSSSERTRLDKFVNTQLS